MTFSREAVKFFCKAVKFFCKAVTFYLSPLTSYYMDSLTGKHLTHVAHVAPNSGWEKSIEERGDALPQPELGVGWATWVGCFPFSLTYARTRVNLTAHP